MYISLSLFFNLLIIRLSFNSSYWVFCTLCSAHIPFNTIALNCTQITAFTCFLPLRAFLYKSDAIVCFDFHFLFYFYLFDQKKVLSKWGPLLAWLVKITCFFVVTNLMNQVFKFACLLTDIVYITHFCGMYVFIFVDIENNFQLILFRFSLLSKKIDPI